MSEEEKEKLLIDEEETVQIKDLNRVKDVKNTDLLLLDDGVANSNAITYENFLKTTKDKTFKGEGLSYFKEIIKSTIAEELAADTSFVEKIYNKIINKLINNDPNNISNLFSKIKSRLTNSISSATLSKYDNLLIMPNSSTIQKTPVPKQLLGVPADYEYSGTTYGNTLYPYEYKNKSIYIDLEYGGDITLIFYKNNDDDPIYLDIQIHAEHHAHLIPKMIYLRYSDESKKTILYEHTGVNGSSTIFPLLQGWYVQKRRNRSGGAVPNLLKL
ncbi:conserved hypothetical protein (plasmid) [Borreliella finlandensis]|uniref:Uncharacterized protein n=1 Tax=Borreliella finlandensis TaxID=498741 RepID=A0A826GQT5_9SPIR|nr:DUF685 domain-containing protein [Borreliella finlandensis]ACN93323.1 conserved hypothetical protein [Borreliella finlandensis]ACN93441.1 conserved hypothetical protein [Borreliella finlandensis]EEH00316.1 conserved hypothetical protein [Borreliella finlandensis]